MSTVVQAKCPNCKTEVSVEEEVSTQSVSCTSCETRFIPSEVIAASNKQFEVLMYVGMLLIGLILIGYMAMTGQLNPNGAQVPPVAEEAAE